MANDGLLFGLAEGLKSGINAYDAQKERLLKYKMYEEERKAKELAKKQEKVGLIFKAQEAGYSPQMDESGEVSGFEYNTESPAAKKMKLETEGKILDQDKTRSEIGKIRAETKKIGNEAKKGKELPASSLTDISAATNAVNQLGKLKQSIDNNKSRLGLLKGGASMVKGMLNQDDDAVTLQTQVDANVQEIGRFLEGGKLAEGDAKRYKAMAPKLTDTPKAAQGKIKILENLIADKQAANLSALQAGGFNTEGIPKAGGFPRKVRKGNQEATVSSDAELKEAQAEGFL